MRVSRRLHIHGRVQGVCYRDWTVETARGLSLDGWVRNRADGHVEIVVAGEEETVAAFVARCQEGPPAARVERIDMSDAGEEPAPGFRRAPSA
jgi:acylphosphatase